MLSRIYHDFMLSTLIILFIGMVVACICRRWRRLNPKQNEKAKYSKVVNIDTTDDEEMAINK